MHDVAVKYMDHSFLADPVSPYNVQIGALVGAP